MKTLIQILLVALVFGGASAGGSLYWLKLNKKPVVQEEAAKADNSDEKNKNQDEDLPDSESTEITETPPPEAPSTESLADIKPSKPAVKKEPAQIGPPVAVRPPFNPNADEAGELIYKLRLRMASSTRQERRVSEREDAMELILDDLGAEQIKTVTLKKQLLDEQKHFVKNLDSLYADVAETKRQTEEKLQVALREKEQAISAAEEKMKSAREQIDELRSKLDEAQKPSNGGDRSGSPELSANLKKAAGTLDSMPPEDTAKILKESVKEGRTEAVVALLNAMKPRICAKVISEITANDSELAADLIERLKRLKKEAEGAKPPAN